MVQWQETGCSTQVWEFRAISQIMGMCWNEGKRGKGGKGEGGGILFICSRTVPADQEGSQKGLPPITTRILMVWEQKEGEKLVKWWSKNINMGINLGIILETAPTEMSLVIRNRERGRGGGRNMKGAEEGGNPQCNEGLQFCTCSYAYKCHYSD